jgi:hypothetical protein
MPQAIDTWRNETIHRVNTSRDVPIVTPSVPVAPQPAPIDVQPAPIDVINVLPPPNNQVPESQALIMNPHGIIKYY